MGHDVVLSNSDIDDFFVHAENARWLGAHRPGLTDELWNEFESEHLRKRFDLAFLYLADGFIDFDVIHRMREKGVVTVNFSCNNIHQFHLVKEISTHVDYAVFTEKNAEESFIQVGARAVHMQMAANPILYRHYALPYDYDVTFVGQRYADRGHYIASLIRHGINAHAFGARWTTAGEQVGNVSFKDRLDKLRTILQQNGLPYVATYVLNALRQRSRDREENASLQGHAHDIVDDDEMIKLYSRSKINLGFSAVFEGARVGGEKLQHIRLRDFEIPMSGGFYMTGFVEELAEYYDIGKEIECYASFEELIDKAEFYLANEPSRERIRQAGLKRSLSDHRWQNRFTKLFTRLGLVGDGEDR
jgi:spore maturation protein CgeB